MYIEKDDVVVGRYLELKSVLPEVFDVSVLSAGEVIDLLVSKVRVLSDENSLVEELEEEITELREEVKDLKGEVNDLNDEIIDSEVEIKILEKKVEDLEYKNDYLREENDRLEDELIKIIEDDTDKN